MKAYNNCNITLFLNNVPIKYYNSAKSLGLIFDEHLSCKTKSPEFLTGTDKACLHSALPASSQLQLRPASSTNLNDIPLNSKCLLNSRPHKIFSGLRKSNEAAALFSS